MLAIWFFVVDKIANILLDHWKSKRLPEKHLLLCWLCQSLWLCRSQQTVENYSRDRITRPPDLPLEKSVCRSRSKLEPDMEERTGSKLGKEYVKAVYRHPASLTYMQCTWCEMSGWMKHKLESRLLGEISITSDMQMTPPYDRKRRTKEPLDENEIGECKSWLKT